MQAEARSSSEDEILTFDGVLEVSIIENVVHYRTFCRVAVTGMHELLARQIEGTLAKRL
jgi:hypothetical protein